MAALFLTTWHQVFGTIMTQYMARCTKTLDSRHKVPMTTRTYMWAAYRSKDRLGKARNADGRMFLGGQLFPLVSCSA